MEGEAFEWLAEYYGFHLPHTAEEDVGKRAHRGQTRRFDVLSVAHVLEHEVLEEVNEQFPGAFVDASVRHVPFPFVHHQIHHFEPVLLRQFDVLEDYVDALVVRVLVLFSARHQFVIYVGHESVQFLLGGQMH